MKVLFDKYRVQSETTIDLMNKWIINHEEDFIEINSYGIVTENNWVDDNQVMLKGDDVTWFVNKD